jgi:hypothetical protein
MADENVNLVQPFNGEIHYQTHAVQWAPWRYVIDIHDALLHVIYML